MFFVCSELFLENDGIVLEFSEGSRRFLFVWVPLKNIPMVISMRLNLVSIHFLQKLLIYDVFGEPETLPRVGDECQVEIPPLAAISYFMNNLTNAKITGDGPYNFLMGLPYQ
ncbi:PREDICTED: LOC18793088 isoform X2 [Prunus dulcis]|uniref:PREDICTED: LOC18793088 isoform X2 n=1 Tax=Prunus dulcis TaxID=3755 RepID=A0A5E4EMA8_PRUDU|nr:PREDICTED: LOC18793088 isoform X2 [Prunus dulcis]